MAVKKDQTKSSLPGLGSLRTARGTSARAVPGLIRDLLTKDSALALRKLGDLLAPNNTVCEATGPALVPLLAVLQEALPERKRVADLTLQLAELGRPDALAAFGMDPEQPELRHYASPPGSGIPAAIESQVDALAALAQHDDPVLRMVGARLLGYARHRAEAGLVPLLARLEVETDERVLPWTMFACHHLALAAPEASTRVQGAVLAAGTRARTALCSSSARIVVAHLRRDVGDLTSKDVAKALEDALIAWDADAARLSPWRTAFIDGTLLAILGSTRLGGVGRHLAAQAVIQAGTRIGADIGMVLEPFLDEWVTRVLRWYFVEHPGSDGYLSLSQSPVRVETLDAEQRDVLAGISSFENHRLGSVYLSFGLPQDALSRLRWLGLRPGSLLEREVAPGQQLWQVVVQAYQTDEGPPFEERLSPFVAKMTRAERLDLWSELQRGAYQPQSFERSILEHELAEATATEVLAWGDRLLALGSDRSVVERLGGPFFAPAILAKLPPGAPIPERFDRLFTMFGGEQTLRDLFVRLPSSRAKTIFDRALSTSSMSAYDCCERGARLADIHPDIADSILSYYSGRTPPSGTVSILTEARGNSQRLDDLLRRYGL